MRRLSHQIHLTVAGALLLLVVLAGLTLHSGPRGAAEHGTLETLLGEWLPGPDRPGEELQAAVARLGGLLGADVAVHDASGTLLAASGSPLGEPGRPWRGWHFGGRGRLSATFALPGERRLQIRLGPRLDPGPFGWLLALLIMAGAVGLAAGPVVRRLTGRLERLRDRVEALGRGDLAARVEVEGRDEVAALARSFNDAADRLERLVSAQRTLLASASHELRTPLARLRVGLELLGEGRPELRDRLAADVAELDDRVGELLLASRAEAWQDLARSEPVELLGLVAEEAARLQATASGEEVRIQGDPLLLRHMVRHLLQNASRHAQGREVEASAGARAEGGARVAVEDRGPGIPESERERIFEPYYRPPGSQGSGVGIGLALVRRIAERHGGSVRCLAREGGGTRFEVDLPA